MCLCLTVYLCVREYGGIVYLGKGASMLKQLDVAAYQSGYARHTEVWGDTEPHMIPANLCLHSNLSIKAEMKHPFLSRFRGVLLFSGALGCFEVKKNKKPNKKSETKNDRAGEEDLNNHRNCEFRFTHIW